jgi:Leucine-rich repeat (LRR) protein
MFNEMKAVIDDVIVSQNSPRTKNLLISQAMTSLESKLGKDGVLSSADGSTTPPTDESSSINYDVLSSINFDTPAGGGQSSSSSLTTQVIAPAESSTTTSAVPRMEDLEDWVESTGVDCDLSDVNSIEELDFSESSLATLPDSLILIASNVTEFALEKNDLEIIPGPVIGAFTNLVELYLRENQLTSLPEEVRKSF